jgi:hypothetical protein
MEQQVASQHSATPLAEPLQQLDSNLPNTLKRGEKAMYGGRSLAQRKKARIAAAEPTAAAAEPATSIEPSKALARRAVPGKHMATAAALSARNAKENRVPATSMALLQHATP